MDCTVNGLRARPDGGTSFEGPETKLFFLNHANALLSFVFLVRLHTRLLS